jgi:hypothetical protein
MDQTVNARKIMLFTLRAVSWPAIGLLLPHIALSANVFLTNTQFVNRGAGAFVGEITNVQVLSSDAFSESGTVQLHVTSVIAGTVSAETLAFAYQRALSPTDDASNWDLLAPTYVSLQKIAVGRSILIHFTESGGTYSLASAGNAVQDAGNGVLLGKIVSTSKGNSDRGTVDIEIMELVYGWVNGAQVSLPCSKVSVGSGHDRSGSSTPEVVRHANGCDINLGNAPAFFSYDSIGINGVEAATSELLQQLKQADQQ